MTIVILALLCGCVRSGFLELSRELRLRFCLSLGSLIGTCLLALCLAALLEGGYGPLRSPLQFLHLSRTRASRLVDQGLDVPRHPPGASPDGDLVV